MNLQKRTNSSSTLKGLALLVFLVIMFVVTSKLRKNGFSPEVANLMNTDFSNDLRKIKALDEAGKEAQKKEFAGFWVYNTVDPEASVQKSHHLELKDNGIIWEVIHWFLTFPSGDTLSLFHARQAYLNPYGKLSDGLYSCEVRVIRQIFINGIDTCYGASQVDEIWTAEMGKDGLIINNRQYSTYDSEITAFFPEGMIDLVDKVLLNSCKPGSSLPFFASTQLKEKISSSIPVAFNQQSITEWIKQYYEPLIIEEMLFSSNPGIIPDSFQVKFSIAENGSVFALKSMEQLIQENRFSKKLLQEMSSWTFPKLEAGSKNTEVLYTFKNSIK